jgi:hypothetical protein
MVRQNDIVTYKLNGEIYKGVVKSINYSSGRNKPAVIVGGEHDNYIVRNWRLHLKYQDPTVYLKNLSTYYGLFTVKRLNMKSCVVEDENKNLYLVPFRYRKELRQGVGEQINVGDTLIGKINFRETKFKIDKKYKSYLYVWDKLSDTYKEILDNWSQNHDLSKFDENVVYNLSYGYI